jgi:hypothetical protein
MREAEEEVGNEFKTLHSEERDLYRSPGTVRVVSTRSLKWGRSRTQTEFLHGKSL